MTEPHHLKPAHDNTWEVLQGLAEEGADPMGLARPFKMRLAEADWEALADKGQPVRFLGGSVIFREGDAGDLLYVVISGRVAVLKEKGDGQSALLAYRGPGDILGEMTVMSRIPRSATVIAVEDTDLLYVDGPAFRALTSSTPGICRTMLEVLAERLRAADIARTVVVQEERNLAKQLREWTTEAERLGELARLRQQTVDLIVHDLRSPLGVIRGCLEVLEETVGEDSLRVVSVAHRSTNRLLSLVEALLQAARQEVLGVALDRQFLDLSSLLQVAVDSLRATVTPSDVQLVLDLPPDLPCPLGDKNLLERVVGNILDNAIAYTPDGGRVTLSATVRGGEIEISVTDTGPGVPREYREQIFERFTRVPGLKGRRRGFGLGLYFCRQVLQAHGGRIWVEPGPGNKGSRFAFTLPLEASKAG
jgi:signal transduction histidine kinase